MYIYRFVFNVLLAYEPTRSISATCEYRIVHGIGNENIIDFMSIPVARVLIHLKCTLTEHYCVRVVLSLCFFVVFVQYGWAIVGSVRLSALFNRFTKAELSRCVNNYFDELAAMCLL